MKFYKPIFSLIVIAAQLFFSLKAHFRHQHWKKENAELDALISYKILYDSFFLFVLVVGLAEMLTKPGRIKNLIRILLAAIVLGFNFSGLIPIDDLNFGVYYTAQIAAVLAIPYIIWQFMNFRQSMVDL